MRTTIILLPASVVTKLAPTFAQNEKQDALFFPLIAPVAGYWRRPALAIGHSAAETWGHSRLHS
jgi:hypothetical protein